ncbi:MAG: cytochrome P450 [Flavobacteriaceae bacterium]
MNPAPPFKSTLHWSQLLRNSKRLVKNPIPFHHKWFHKFGETLKFRFFNGTKVFLTRDPEFALHVLRKNHKNYYKSDVTSEGLGQYIGKGLLTLNGDAWKKDRRLLQPGFYKERIRKLFDGVIPQTITKVLGQIPQNTPTDIKPYMNQLAFEVVTHALFEMKIEQHRLEEIRQIIDSVQEHFVKKIRQPQWNFWRYLTGVNSSIDKKVRRIRSIMDALVEERIASETSHEDLLDLMLNATYEDGSKMERGRIIDELIILIVAGHETTANALCFLCYELGQNPEYLEKVKAEIQSLEGSTTPYEQLGQLPYAQAVVNETLRRYPPAWIVDRKALAEDQIGAEWIPKDAFIAVSIYELHHHPDYWDNPMTFLPERFLKPPPAVYIPFGAGPRMCIGNHFALFEMTEVLRQLALHYTLTPITKTPNSLALITLQPERLVLCLNQKDD